MEPADMGECPSDSFNVSPSGQRRRPAPPSRAYLACYLVLTVILVPALAGRFLGSPISDGPGPANPARVAEIDQRVDPNTAGWGELATLPGIGEVLAKRIVEYRQEQGAGKSSADSLAAVFHAPADLEAVRGIGPKTVARMEPFLRFSPSLSSHGQAAQTPMVPPAPDSRPDH
jgi:hypothetical protein